MTGIEAAAVAAGAGVAKAFSSNEAEREAMDELQRENSMLWAAADAKAKRAAVRERVLLNLWKPIAKAAGISDVYFRDEFAEEVVRRSGHVPSEHLTTPRPAVILPAVQGLGWSLGEPELREMYLNLIAKAVDDRAGSHTHPAYTDVLRQVQPEEAVALVEFINSDSAAIPIVDVHAVDRATGLYSVAAVHLVDPAGPLRINQIDDDTAGLWIANWLRLGLVSITAGEMASLDDPDDHSNYGYWEAHPTTIAMAEAYAERDFEPEPGVLRSTFFGHQFGGAVSPAASDEAPAGS